MFISSDIIKEIHWQYLAAGADIIETTHFNSTSIAQADYKLSHLAREVNVAAARLAKDVCEKFMQSTQSGAVLSQARLADQQNRVSFSRCQRSRLPRGFFQRTGRCLL